jgi:membrane protease YdiL (CAAX protease family)
MTGHDPHCPECGAPVGKWASRCIHCSADLTAERESADGTDADSTRDDVETRNGVAPQDGVTPPRENGPDASDDTMWGHLRLVAVCLGLSVGGIVLGTAVGLVILVGLFLVGVEPSPTDELVVSLVSVQGVAFPGVSYAYFRYKGRSLREFIPVSVPTLREVVVILGAWIGAFVLVVFTAGLIVGLSGTEPASNQAGETAAQNPEFIPFLIPLVFLLNAPGEELLFRGVIQGLFRERFGPVAAILLATSMFAPIHIFALAGGVQAVLVTITLLSIPSIVFGATYEYTDNFLVPTLVHALYNATLFGLLFLSSTLEGTSEAVAGLAVLISLP